MSGWDAYIDSLVGHSKDSSGTDHVDKACIVGTNGAAWTSAGHAKALKITPQEGAKIASNIELGYNSSFGAEGIVVEGVKYQFLRIDPETKVALGKKKGAGSITCQGIKTAVVIAHCPEGGQHGACNGAVEKVASYLGDQGY